MNATTALPCGYEADPTQRMWDWLTADTRRWRDAEAEAVARAAYPECAGEALSEWCAARIDDDADLLDAHEAADWANLAEALIEGGWEGDYEDSLAYRMGW